MDCYNLNSFSIKEILYLYVLNTMYSKQLKAVPLQVCGIGDGRN